jgi:primosomal protein N' (replication factor Y)
MPREPRFLKVAVPTPLYKTFDYLAPDARVETGARVRVPFGRRELVGVVVEKTDTCELPATKLKPVLRVLDDAPLLNDTLLGLLRWTADYYQHPLGETLATALPVHLRQGKPARIFGDKFYLLTDRGRQLNPDHLKRAKTKQKIFTALLAAEDGLSSDALNAQSARGAPIVKYFLEQGWVHCEERLAVEPPLPGVSAPTLTTAQQAAVEEMAQSPGGFQTWLLHGVTGSGKTEVYLRVVEKVLARGLQVLVLVPEIGLTPQLVARFRSRLVAPVALYHSNLSDTERLNGWCRARDGSAWVILGTRSAVFLPFARLGLIVVDEEHDASFKQQDGLRYHARDLAVLRASREKIPVVLGSATPSLESLKAVRDNRYRPLSLPERTGAAGMPNVGLLDARKFKLHDGLSAPLREAISQRLARHEQSLLFLNRRGFSPAWMCHGCGWLAPCARCDAKLTYHRAARKLRCHHCGSERELITQCPACNGAELNALGAGTERVEEALGKIFPSARLVRIDRDSTRAKHSLEEKLKAVDEGRADILIGTQMLTKGHDFPNVTLVGVLNADQGLFGTDFHAPERMFQQILQVGGRAGRADKPGQVLIQTWHPDHPIFTALSAHDFNGFVDYALAERQATHFPPFSFLALLRAESPTQSAAFAFLQRAHALGAGDAKPFGVSLFEPVASPMPRRAGRYRAQLLAQADKRPALQAFLREWVRNLSEEKFSKRVRWSVDVDPVDMY